MKGVAITPIPADFLQLYALIFQRLTAIILHKWVVAKAVSLMCGRIFRISCMSRSNGRQRKETKEVTGMT